MNHFIPVTRIFGQLFLQEINEPLLQQLQQPDIADSLAELGVAVPTGPNSHDLIERLSAEYCSCFVVAPDQVPLVQSIWEHGSYEGKATAALRELADTAGFDYDREAARNAPIDHLGSVLILWAELVADDWSEGYQYLAEHHLLWAKEPLARLAQREGFYAQLAAATIELIDQICPATSN